MFHIVELHFIIRDSVSPFPEIAQAFFEFRDVRVSFGRKENRPGMSRAGGSILSEDPAEDYGFGRAFAIS